MTTIGFIGLGHMGHPMAHHLLKAGYQVYVYDVIRDAAKTIEKDGALIADSIAALTREADVVITSVQTGQQVTDICLTHEGIFSYAKPGLLYIDCSSIDIITTDHLHEEADKLHIDMVDAPVSGGV